MATIFIKIFSININFNNKEGQPPQWFQVFLLAILLLLLLFGSSSCKKFIQVGPPKDQTVSSTIYSSDASATSVIKGIYSQMINGTCFSGGANSITYLAGLSSDEFTNFSSATQSVTYWRNALNSTLVNTGLWSEPYKLINNANALIENLQASNGVTPATAKELTGEAKFVRAFCYFYLTSLYGDVPLILSTDYTKNAIASRAPKDSVYNQIVQDLLDAQSALLSDFSKSGGERVQPNKFAATALLARVYLYKGDWANAIPQATIVISNPTYSLNTDLTKVFLANSSEAIWQLKPYGGNINTNEGNMFIPVSTPSYATVSPILLSSFETGDLRRANWVGILTVGTSTYYYPFKYKVRQSATLTEYSMVLRLAEQFLIRAEAKAQQNDVGGAQADLNVIRTRAGLSNTTANDKTSLLSAIAHERQVEFFSEWGHRWLDIKRLGIVDAVMSGAASSKGTTWQSFEQLYPLPYTEILNDNNLSQNSGY